MSKAGRPTAPGRRSGATDADRAENERDYGDSAGYGGGGTALDYDEVLGDESSRRDIGRNPLDEVVRTEKQGESSEQTKGADSSEALAGPHAKPELTNPDATPGAGALPTEPTEGDADPGVG